MTVLVPVMHRDALGFPEHEMRDVGPDGESYDACAYAPLEAVLTEELDFDAHLCAYSLPNVPRRLAKEPALAHGPLMVLFVVDVDGPNHVVTPEWWAEERKKLDVLLSLCPGGFVYRTGGGYRIVYRLAAPLLLRSRADAARWRASYEAWLAVLRDGVGIEGDGHCSDWARLFRAPHVTRDGVLQHPEVIGDPDSVGIWNEPFADLVEVDATNARPLTFVGTATPERWTLAAEILGDAWAAHGVRHDAHLALAGALARGGWDAESIAAFAEQVAERAEAGNGDYDRRLKDAAGTVSKIADGDPFVTGWPSLEEHVDPAAVFQARKLLGFPDPVEYDESFVARMRARAVALDRPPMPPAPVREGAPPPEPVVQHETALDVAEGELDAHIKSAQKRLAKANDPESLRSSDLLKRISRGEFLTDDVNEDRIEALGMAALALARVAPPGVTPAQLERRLLPSAGVLAADVPEAIQDAIEAARELPALLRPARQRVAVVELAHDDFAIDYTGPRAGCPTSASRRNVRVALRKMGVVLRYNEFAGRTEITIGEQPTAILEDHHVMWLLDAMEREHDYRPPKEMVFDQCTVVSRDNSYHPVRDYFDSLQQDAPITDITETWLIRFAGAPDTPYVRAVSRIVLCAAARRIRKPGCKFDEMLVLETPTQGKNKSTALRVLCPVSDWFTDNFNFRDASDHKKMLETTEGRWIIEAGELKGMSDAAYNDVKQYLSRGTDSARMSYARNSKNRPRDFIVLGSTNEERYLPDPTGNRRVWPVRIIEFNVVALVAARDQLWAEASRLERENPEDSYIRLDPSLYAAAADEQAERQVEDPFQILLEGVFGGHVGRVSVNDVWKLLFGDKIPTKKEQQMVSTAMKAIGFRQRQSGPRGGRTVQYLRGDGPESDVTLKLAGTVGQWRVQAAHGPHQGPHPGHGAN